MDAISLLRQNLQQSHQFLEMTVSDLAPEQAHWLPPGRAVPPDAHYAHIVISEDAIMNGPMLRGAAPLFASSWAGKVGVSEPPPQFPEPWDEWARRVKVDLAALKQYAQAVYAASDEYLASLTADDLSRSVDLPGLGKQNVAFVIGGAVIGHVNSHMGEISCLKGLQGSKGYPF